MLTANFLVSVALISALFSALFKLLPDVRAAGALVVVMLWVYYSSQILFFGTEESKMKLLTKIVSSERGAMGWGVLWLLGIPLPILALLFLARGCT